MADVGRTYAYSSFTLTFAIALGKVQKHLRLPEALNSQFLLIFIANLDIFHGSLPYFINHCPGSDEDSLS